ncbi:hypothetical protein N9Y17_02735 [Gammaproteobacteria bacterium]|nr:hypothetical protein [Gammaproteobacteria bacterium]
MSIDTVVKQVAAFTKIIEDEITLSTDDPKAIEQREVLAKKQKNTQEQAKVINDSLKVIKQSSAPDANQKDEQPGQAKTVTVSPIASTRNANADPGSPLSSAALQS